MRAGEILEKLKEMETELKGELSAFLEDWQIAVLESGRLRSLLRIKGRLGAIRAWKRALFSLAEEGPERVSVAEVVRRAKEYITEAVTEAMNLEPAFAPVPVVAPTLGAVFGYLVGEAIDHFPEIHVSKVQIAVERALRSFRPNSLKEILEGMYYVVRSAVKAYVEHYIEIMPRLLELE